MTAPDFKNTAIAFQMHENSSLRRAYWLFKSISSPSLVRTGNAIVVQALKIGLPVRWAIKPTIYRQFVGGETIKECSPVVQNLAGYGVKSVLDFSIEGKEEDADQAEPSTWHPI
ncbi:MAG: hypothetical protein CVU06_16440 [Bacteroidetes bacterium HGW-Bacteroidetes-22]|nr:MAG: hypothetical protein CVU06_16440 [Bacteroidetes bacterium HGW-Bacteroidetes-22]